MIEEIIALENGKAQGYLIDLGNAPLILIRAGSGFVMCGYMNIEIANKLGDIAGKVTGVKSFEDVLNANIVEISENAEKKGLKVGITAREFLNKCF
jgi:uncharacterized protein YunC (DUF1805 family)